jgi:LytTr DNA-binding domain
MASKRCFAVRLGNFVSAVRLLRVYRSRSMNGPRQIPPPRKLAFELSVMAIAAVVLAALGPFGTWSSNIETRLLIWAIFAFGGYACFRPVILAGDALAAQSSLPRWTAIAAACVLASMPTTLLVAITFSSSGWRGVTAGELAALYSQVLIVGCTVTIIQLLVRRSPPPAGDTPGSAIVADTSAPEPTEIAAPLPEPTFYDRIPPHLGREILCLENEDHYVRIHTALGNVLILMRLRDAVTQLAWVEGEQVHRSWWVAKAAVSTVLRTDRRIWLKLVDGREVPVSRSALPRLRQSGWL